MKITLHFTDRWIFNKLKLLIQTNKRLNLTIYSFNNDSWRPLRLLLLLFEGVINFSHTCLNIERISWTVVAIVANCSFNLTICSWEFCTAFNKCWFKVSAFVAVKQLTLLKLRPGDNWPSDVEWRLLRCWISIKRTIRCWLSAMLLWT